MRHDAATPTQVVLDLLRRADELAAAAADAIDVGDHDRLAAVLDDRQEVIAGAIGVWQELSPGQRSPELVHRVARAAQSTVALGERARDVALQARAQVVAELSAFDARQTASQEYQSDAPRSSIDLVL
ncbi:MAG: hypothetical protein U5K74_04565 [Gemmatimonadaceae bacterium]|nr:hypothetical protein [Gemmatimonadaceae bacterium]